MSVHQVSAESSVSPNLVPMVDIMFLLLLFLMVGADMGNRELEDVRLPVAKSAADEKRDDGERLTLNVYHAAAGCAAYDVAQLCADRSHWAIGARGNDFRDEARLLGFLEGIAREDRERSGRETSDVRVLLRADQAALFEHVQLVMSCCSQARIYKVEIGAATAAEER